MLNDGNNREVDDAYPIDVVLEPIFSCDPMTSIAYLLSQLCHEMVFAPVKEIVTGHRFQGAMTGNVNGRRDRKFLSSNGGNLGVKGLGDFLEMSWEIFGGRTVTVIS